MDSDSDSDDSVLNFDAFGTAKTATKRQQHYQEKRVAKGFSILDQAMERADQMKENDEKMALLKKDHAVIGGGAAAAVVAGDTNGSGSGNAPAGATTTTTEEEDHEAFMAGVEQSIAKGRAPRPTNESHEREHKIAGILEDLEDVLGQERCLALGKARDTDLNSVLGARRIVSFDPHRTLEDDNSTASSYFDTPLITNNNSHNSRSCNKKTTRTTTTTPTTADYIKQLKQLLRKLVSPNQKVLQTAWIQPLRQVTKHQLEFKLFLEQQQLARLRHDHHLEDIPEDLLVWLLRVACSADAGDGNTSNGNKDGGNHAPVQIRDGAMETLQALLWSNHVLADARNSSMNDKDQDEGDNESCDNGERIPKPAFLSLSQMAVQLLAWIPLAANKDANPQSSGQDSNTNSSNLDQVNPRGLQRLFSIWYAALGSNQVSVSVGKEGAATRCLVLLVKVGLDDRLRSTDRYVQFSVCVVVCVLTFLLWKLEVMENSPVLACLLPCFVLCVFLLFVYCSDFRLVEHLKCLISKLLEFVKQFVFCHDDTHYLEWTNDTSKAIVDELVQSKLGPGDEDMEDCNDDMAWGCFAQACWVLPLMARTHSSKTDCRFQKSAVQFKAAYCLQTLEHFFTSSSSGKKSGKSFQSWQEEVYAIVSKCQTESKAKYDLVERAKQSLRWRVLCSSLAALVKLNDLGTAVRENECKCLATLQIALGRCLEVGMEFYLDDAITNDKEDDSILTTSQSTAGKINEYKTKDEARDVARLLGLLKFQCTQLASRMGTSLMNSYFTRAGYFIQCHIKYFDEAQAKAANLGGERAIVQGSLERWLKKDQTAASKRSSNSDDEEMEEADDDEVDEFNDIDEEDFDDDFDDDFEEELEDDYEIEIEDEISAEFGLSGGEDGELDEEEDIDDFDDFDEADLS